MPEVLDPPKKAVASKTSESVGQDRIFRVVKGQVGPFRANEGAVFTEAEFRRLNPIPDTKIAASQIKADTYHADLITRLLKLGNIVSDPTAEPTPTPMRPGGSPPESSSNPMIEQAVNDVLARRAADNQVPDGATVMSKPAEPTKHGGVMPDKR